jgi:hypothetical protein
MRGTVSEPQTEPPDDWSGRAAIDWARRLARAPGYDPAADELVRVSRALDSIYEAAR